MIELRKMSENEFEEYLKVAIAEYAKEKAKGENLSEEDSLKVAVDSFTQLLPNGIKSENQFLFSILNTEHETKIGTLWFARKIAGMKKSAFIYDIVLAPEARGKGYGKIVMKLVEDEAKKLNLTSIGLHVFGHNQVAIHLYKKSGYHVTNQIMSKNI